MVKAEYKFSVVIPIYNTEKYLEEAIESVINQTIGFEDNIQLILVNDGSTDNSKEICLKYKEKYPKNIVYVEQKNSGVSKARNKGKEYVKGKYTNFLDSDDKWEKDAFKKVYDFFEKNYSKINIVSCKQKFFEAREDYHILNYKFTDNEVVNILDKYNYIQLHITASFIKSEILKYYLFDENLKYSEDTKFINEILLDTPLYGIVSNTLHYYRKRNDESSAIQNKSKSKDWYFVTTDRTYIELMNKSKEKYGKIISYIQFLIMYDIQYRVKEKIEETLDENEQKEYVNKIKQIIQCIDNHIICEQIKLSSEYKIYLLSLKYNRNIAKELIWMNNKLYFQDLEIYNLKNRNLLKIMLIDIKDDLLEIEGEVNCFLPKESYKIYALDDKIYNFEYLDDENNNREAFGKIFVKNRRFKVVIPVKDNKKIRIMMKYKDYEARRLTISLGKFTKINSKSYKIDEDFIIRIRNNKIMLNKYSKKLHIKCELSYMKYLAKNDKYNIIVYRLMYYLAKKINKKPVWIISDRADHAGDNGEVFYRFLKNKEKEAKLYYAIKSNCKDYKKMKKIGHVLKIGTIKYKLNFLLAQCIISSQANDWTINAFELDNVLIRDLYNFKFVFLQHGIIHDDMSDWLGKYKKNVDLLVTSAKREKDSIINGNYMYTEKEVKLTGLPRYDILENNPIKKVIFMPTWRKSLQGKVTKGASEYEYNEKFINSEYYKFYIKLINNKELINCLKKNGYIGKFFVHPIFEKQAKDFIGNEIIKIEKNETNYNKELKEAKLLVTDYSSVTFDFAYLNKPIVYTQFDKNEFYKQHTYKEGYYNYEKDGFGKVCYNIEDTVKTIIEIVNNECKQDEIYEKRAKEFFSYHDKNNCQRVYTEILKMIK